MQPSRLGWASVRSIAADPVGSGSEARNLHCCREQLGVLPDSTDVGQVRLREMGEGSLQASAVDGHVDLLVVEGDQSGDRQQLPGREVIGPGEIG